MRYDGEGASWGDRSWCLAIAADDAFATGAIVALASVRRRHREPMDLLFLDCGLTERSRERVDRAVARFGWTVRYERPALERVEPFRASWDWPISVFARIFAPDLCSVTHHRLVYIDADVFVRDGIGALTSIDLMGCGLAAVPDLTVHERFAPHLLDLGFVPGERYFNGGVLVVDLDRWRAEATTAALVELLERSASLLRFADQDLLNLHFRSGWFELAPVWNAQTPQHYRDLRSSAPSADLRSSPGMRSLADAKIVHFTGVKPWLRRVRHPHATRYLLTWLGSAASSRSGLGLPLRLLVGRATIWNLRDAVLLAAARRRSSRVA